MILIFVLPLEGGLGTPQLNRFILARDHLIIETKFKNSFTTFCSIIASFLGWRLLSTFHLLFAYS
jgi:hypothetical protein